jgi:predicted type IV restriction endonuclease
MALNIKKPLKRLLPHLLKAREDNLSEADTIQRIIKVFEEVLGYDCLSEISRECQIRDKYVDLALKVDGNIRILVEVKAAGLTLSDRHIEQAQHYAAVGNIPWVILTNGIEWTLYHLSFNEGVEYVKAFSVDLGSDSLEDAVEQLTVLHRQSFARNSIDEFWQHRTALRPDSIGRAIFAEDTLKLIRREIRKREGILIDEEDLSKAIHEMFSIEAREILGPPKIQRKRKPKSRAASVDISADADDPPTPDAIQTARRDMTGNELLKAEKTS